MLMAPASARVRWVVVGVGAGFVACAAYPVLLLLPLPLRVATLLIALFAAALALASVGLCHFLGAQRRIVLAEIAAGANVLASFAFCLMGLVQLALREGGRLRSAPESVALLVDRVQLGLDVAWDAYLAIGTALFALAMRRHPRLGGLLAWPGLLIALALLIFNFATFPVPPAEAGLVDAGPLVGVWYLAVTIQVLRSLGWLRRELADPGRRPD